MTVEGRGIGVFLMLLGIGSFGVITAGVASYFIASEQQQGATLEDVLSAIQRLEARLDRMESGATAEERLEGQR